MHMSDALLSPAVGTAFWAGSLGAILYSAGRLKDTMDEKMVPLMGVFGAFIFAAQMVNFAIPGTGASGHLGGGMILAILLGPHAAFLSMASVLTVQALFFADGGILALGCNIWNLGLYPAFIAYPLIYRTISGRGGSSRRASIAAIVGSVAGLQLGALSVVFETLLSGKSALSFSAFAPLMVFIHLATGLIEGLITAGVISYVRKVRPDNLDSLSGSRPAVQGPAIKPVLAAFLLVLVITGGLFSWFASTDPDGLEWSLQKSYSSKELPTQEHGLAETAKKLKDRTALLPDYNFSKTENTSVRTGDDRAGTSLSGILGSMMVLVLIIGLGGVIKAARRKKTAARS